MEHFLGEFLAFISSNNLNKIDDETEGRNLNLGEKKH